MVCINACSSRFFLNATLREFFSLICSHVQYWGEAKKDLYNFRFVNIVVQIMFFFSSFSPEDLIYSPVISNHVIKKKILQFHKFEFYWQKKWENFHTSVSSCFQWSFLWFSFSNKINLVSNAHVWVARNDSQSLWKKIW